MESSVKTGKIEKQIVKQKKTSKGFSVHVDDFSCNNGDQLYGARRKIIFAALYKVSEGKNRVSYHPRAIILQP